MAVASSVISRLALPPRGGVDAGACRCRAGCHWDPRSSGRLDTEGPCVVVDPRRFAAVGMGSIQSVATTVG